MELQKLYYFVAAAQSGSFRKAAAICAVAQPVLSRQIASLEAELGVLLFERGRSGVRLTAAGESFAGYATNALDQIQQGRQMLMELDSGTRGDVAVGCIEPLVAPFVNQVIVPFQKRYPLVRLQLCTGGADDMLARVEERSLDFGLFGLPLDQVQLMEQLRFHELFRDRVQLIVPAGHALAIQAGKLFVEQLVAVPCVMLRQGFRVRHVIEQAFARVGHTLKPAVEVDTLGSLLTCVSQGLGVTFFPPKLLHTWAHPYRLTMCPVEDLRDVFAFGVVYRRHQQISPPATALIRTVLNASLWSDPIRSL
jgi:LysR family transcriptional regulator, cyn operon transcriptional activator